MERTFGMRPGHFLAATLSFLFPANAFAFQKVDDFESYAAGPLTTVASGVWSAHAGGSLPQVALNPAGGNVLSFGSSTAGNFPFVYRQFPAGQEIPSTGLSTFYFRVCPKGARIDHSIGLVDGISAVPAFTDFHTQVAFLNANTNGATHFKIVARSAGNTWEVMASAPKNQWYDIWVVVDRSRGNYDVWFSGDGKYPVLIANDYDFRTATTQPLNSVLAVCNNNNSDNASLELDDLHVLPGRQDLSRPLLAGIQPQAFRVVSYNMHSGTDANGNGSVETNLAAFRDRYLNGEHIICLQEVQQSQWQAIRNLFPTHPHTLLTVKRSTSNPFNVKTECLAILSSLPILESDSEIMQIDPTGDRWQRYAQYVKVDLGGDRSAPVFHYHNTYVPDTAAQLTHGRSGLEALKSWVSEKFPQAPTIASVPNLILTGDFNLSSTTEVTNILPLAITRNNWVDYVMSNVPEKSGAVLWTSGVLTDHNGVASTLNLDIIPDVYERWAVSAFSMGERLAGHAAPATDPDKDGMTNFSEYAFQLNPWRNQPLPVANATHDSGVAEFSFRRASAPTDIDYKIWESSTLIGEWQVIANAPAGGPMTLSRSGFNLQETLDAGAQTQQIRIKPGSPGPASFFKMEAIQTR